MRTAGVIALPRTRLPFTLADGELVPAWLGDRDRPWLRDLLEQAEAFVGRPLAEWHQQVQRGDPDPRAGQRRFAAAHVLHVLLRQSALAPRRAAARAALFRLAARGVARDQALAEVAHDHGITPDELLNTLYDDLPARRRMHWPDPPPEPTRLALAANLAMVTGLLQHARSATLDLHGASRTVLKTAWLRGLVPGVRADPFTVTTLSWRIDDHVGTPADLTALVPLLPWTRRYRLRARCELPNARGDLVLTTGDPILPGEEPRRFDSDLERRFACDFRRLLPDWELVREPAPLTLAHGMAFPDFELRPPHRGAPWLLELAGLRDRTALAAKLELLHRCSRLILCLPEREVPEAVRDHPRVVPFCRRVDVTRVRAAMTS